MSDGVRRRLCGGVEKACIGGEKVLVRVWSRRVRYVKRLRAGVCDGVGKVFIESVFEGVVVA